MNKTETLGPSVPPTSGGRAAPTMSGLAIIANITDQQWVLHRTYGNFLIRPAPTQSGPCPPEEKARRGGPGLLASSGFRSPVDSTGVRKPDLPSSRQDGSPAAAGTTSGTAYALTEVTARKGTMDLGDKRTLEFPISAREVAEDLVREVNADGGDASYFGVFVCAGAEPTEEELAEAQARLEKFYTDQVRIGDQEWERSHNHQFITDVQRRAARWLGVEKDWCYEPKPLVDCPACGEKLKPGVAVCKSCGAVLDAAKAARFGLLPPPPQAGSATVAENATPPTESGSSTLPGRR